VPLSWNEIKLRAITFSKEWKRDGVRESGDEVFPHLHAPRRSDFSPSPQSSPAGRGSRCARVSCIRPVLDRAVDKCYRPADFPSARSPVEYLFQLYEQLTAPLAPTAKAKRTSRASRPEKSPLPAGEGRGEGEYSNKTVASITLTTKEKLIHDQALVSVLKQLHDDLDAAVFAAYHLPATLTDAEILEHLVALNAERAAEEKLGIIHWLRPEYQNRDGASVPASRDLLTKEAIAAMARPKKRTTARGDARPTGRKAEWPKTLAERVQVVEAALHAFGAPGTPADLARQFKRANPAAVLEILQTLVTSVAPVSKVKSSDDEPTDPVSLKQAPARKPVSKLPAPRATEDLINGKPARRR